MELYMTDSRGNVKNASEKEKLSGNLQKERLIKFSDFMKKCLLKTGVQVSPDYFDLMVQPNGEYDGLLYFSKIPLDSSAGILRRKIAVTRGEFIPESAERLLLDSIFEVRENGKPCWYQLMVNKILLKRNLCDNQWIDVRQEKEMLYCQLKREWSSMVYRKGNTSSSSFFMFSDRNYNHTETLLQTAVSHEKLAKGIEQVLAFYRQNGLQNRDVYSNEKTMFLYQLKLAEPEHHEVYSAFEDMRKFLKRQTGKMANLHYKENSLIWDNPDGQIIFHVCSQNRYNVGGNFYTVQELKKMLAENVNFQQKEWYSSLQPFLSKNNM